MKVKGKTVETVAQTSSVKRCSWKIGKIDRKTPVPESLFYKVAGLRLSGTGAFP